MLLISDWEVVLIEAQLLSPEYFATLPWHLGIVGRDHHACNRPLKLLPKYCV